MEEVLWLFCGMLDLPSVLALRACCRSLSSNKVLCRRAVELHPLSSCVVGEEADWRQAIGRLHALRSALPDSRLGSFSVLRQLGEGPMSQVELARHNATGCLVTLKSYSKALLVANKKHKEAIAEKEMLRVLIHPLVVGLFWTFQTSESLYFVLEYAPFGDLVDYVRAQEGHRVPVVRCEEIVRQIATVLQFIHAQGVCHRDVKAENILIGWDQKIRLIDFATAHKVAEQCENLFVGTGQYIAPEIIKGGVPSTQIDLFGLGCVAFYIWQGSHAFLRDTDFLTWKAILEEPTPTIAVHTQQEAKYLSLVQACLEKDPEKRLCAERFLEKMG